MQPLGPETPPSDAQGRYIKNVRIWNRLTSGEQKVLLDQASERVREETEAAYNQSGLSLNDDQREVFAVRYRQERRRLERELQEKANNERNRRVPEIIEQLRREFGHLSNPAPPGGNNAGTKPAATPSPAASGSPAPVPDRS